MIQRPPHGFWSDPDNPSRRVGMVPCGAAALVILSALGTSLAVAEQPYIERPYLIDGLLQLDPVGKTPEPTAPQGKPWSMPSDYPAPKTREPTHRRTLP